MEDVESIKRKAQDICQYFISEKLKKYGDNISCSIGISCYPQNGEDCKLLLDKADKALYMAKNQGKSQYVFYNESQMENISYSTVLSQVESDTNDKEQPE
jgi:diguanylate cyclase (GGDEF)-like protein